MSTSARSRTGALASKATREPGDAIIGRSFAPSPTATVVRRAATPASAAHSRSASALASASMIGPSRPPGQAPVGDLEAVGPPVVEAEPSASGSSTSWKPPETTPTTAARRVHAGDHLGDARGHRDRARPTSSNTDTGRPARVATRARRLSSKSSSPFIARTVISRDLGVRARGIGEQLDHLVLDERRVDVEDDEEARHAPAYGRARSADRADAGATGRRGRPCRPR